MWQILAIALLAGSTFSYPAESEILPAGSLDEFVPVAIQKVVPREVVVIPEDVKTEQDKEIVPVQAIESDVAGGKLAEPSVAAIAEDDKKDDEIQKTAENYWGGWGGGGWGRGYGGGWGGGGWGRGYGGGWGGGWGGGGYGRGYGGGWGGGGWGRGGWGGWGW